MDHGQSATSAKLRANAAKSGRRESPTDQGRGDRARSNRGRGRQKELERVGYAEALHHAAEPIVLIDTDHRVTYANPAFEELFGYTADAIVGQSIALLGVEGGDTDTQPLAIGAITERGECWRGEVMRQSAEGIALPVWLAAAPLFDGRLPAGSVATYVDLRRIRATERALEDKRRELHMLMNNLPGMVYRCRNDHHWTMEFVSDGARALTGYTPADLERNRTVAFGELIHADDREPVWNAVQAAVSRGDSYVLEYRIRDATGALKWVWERGTPVNDSESESSVMEGFITDITERKHMEEALRHAHQVIENSPVVAYRLRMGPTRSMEYLSENIRQFGYSSEEILSGSMTLENLIEPADHARVSQALEQHIAKGAAECTDEYRIRTRDGEVRWVSRRALLERDSTGEVTHMAGLFADITERKQTELVLQRVNRALRTISAGNEVLIRADAEAELLAQICRVVVETDGYAMAWIGLKQDDPDKTVVAAATAGGPSGHLGILPLTWGDTADGHSPVGDAIRTGVARIVPDVEAEPAAHPWREAVKSQGYASCIALPLATPQEVLGVLSIYSAESNAFDPEEVKLLSDLASDTAYGMVSLRARARHAEAEGRVRQTLEQLKESLEQTVRAIATTVEMRDPYTAGHQRRVANLAAAIARELGMTEDEIEGVYVAGVIHDIGKIHIPAEILSKPGRLNEIEYGLIQTHPQVGYEIVKDIHFPWPVADIVLQHHERLDGSGYPGRLTGDQIVVGARIIAVADVVEAMASHRPYRPGLGITRALEEIERKLGVAYDAQVVRACLILFSSKGFEFSPAQM